MNNIYDDIADAYKEGLEAGKAEAEKKPRKLHIECSECHGPINVTGKKFRMSIKIILECERCGIKHALDENEKSAFILALVTPQTQENTTPNEQVP